MIKSVRHKINIEGLQAYLKIDLSLAIILCIVSQHSFLIKIIGLALLAVMNFKTLRTFQPKKIPLFYTLIPLIEVLKFIFLNDSYSMAHLAQFAVGMSYWISSLIVCWCLYSLVKKGNDLKISNTINLFTILNVCFTLFQFIQICRIEHTVNPYNTWHDHPYGISSGDLINGLFHGVHLTNTFVSLFLLLYYIDKSKPFFIMLTLIPFLLTGNNFGVIVFALCAGICFFTLKGDIKKLWILGSCLTIGAFYYFVTPLNLEYMLQKIFHISRTLPNTSRDLAEKNTMHMDTLRAPGNEDAEPKIILTPLDSTYDFQKQAGKMRSYYQTGYFMRSSFSHALFGSGMGGFSSKLAFNSSGVMEGSSLTKHLPTYETVYFRNNHKAIYKYLKTLHVSMHSESNRPFSVYNQLLGEYGLVGFLLFVICYLWYFLKRINKRTYAVPLLIALLLILNIDYFIEALNILFFFELLMFMDLKEKGRL